MSVRTSWKVLCVGVVVCGLSAAYGQPPYVKFLTGFEATEGFQTTNEVIWMEPLWSGTTVRYANLDPLVEPDGIWAEGDDGFGTPWSESQVVDWGAATGGQSYVIYFIWGNPADTNNPPGFTGPPDTGGNDGVRCTTYSATNLRRPSVHLGGKIRFKMAVVAYADELYSPLPGGETASILMCLGIRETGSYLRQGDPDLGGGDIEWVYLPGSEVVPAAGTNGLIPDLPDTDSNGYPDRWQPPGGKRFLATTVWPPTGGDWQPFEFDLANPGFIRGFANDGTAPDTAGDGLLNAATWGVGDGVNRGALESITFTNDPTDIYGAFFFIWIDDVELEAPEPDPALAPTIQGPIDPCDTQVVVSCDENASEAELFINDISAGTAIPVTGTATFTGLVLNQGDVLKAIQTVFGQTSGFSAPVTVQSVVPPTIQSPVYVFDTDVLVNCDPASIEAELFINDNSAGTAVPSAGVATFSGLSLNDGDVLTAKQTKCVGQTSELSAPVVVERYPAPSIQAPVYQADTTVSVDCDALATQAELYVNDSSVGTATPVSGVATFSSLSLNALDVLQATQTVNATVSKFSSPVLVYLDATWVLADDFDDYDDQTQLNGNWSDDVVPDPADAKVQLAAGGAASCEQLLRENNPSLSSAARLYRSLGGDVYGSDGSPLWVTYHFKHDINSTNARTRFELARFADGQWSTGDRAEGSTGFGFTNGIAGDYLTQYTIILKTTDPQTADTNGFVENYFGYNHALTGVDRAPGVWHTMQIEVRTSVINYYIDGVNVNPIEWPGGVPRPDTGPYQFLIIGLNYSNNGPTMLYDDISVTVGNGSLPFGGGTPPAQVPAAPSAPVLEEPIVPGQTSLTLTDVDTSASIVEVFANYDPTPIGSVTNPTTSTVDVTVSPAVGDGDIITATQTIGGDESCISTPVTAGVPKVTVEGPLDVGGTLVPVTDVHPLAERVTVYVNSSEAGWVDPAGSNGVEVPVSALAQFDIVEATQTINTIEGPPSDPLVVGNTVVVNEFCYDDSSTDNYAFVELYNFGGALDISGWVIQVGDYVTGQDPPGVYYQVFIPAGTTIAANGYWTVGMTDVAGLPGAVVNLIDDSLRLDNGQNYIALRTPSGVLVDAVGWELNKGHTFIPAEIYNQIGPGIWGNTVMNDNWLTSDSRFLDGLDTDNNGRDWGIQAATPGYSNNQPDLMPYYEDCNALTVSDPVPDWSGTYELQRVIDPTVADTYNPEAIPASPDGGLAMIGRDVPGGNADFLNQLAKEDFTLETYVYIAPKFTDTGYEEWKIGVRGTSDGLHNFDYWNGSTGVCWLLQRGTTWQTLYLLDENDGDDGTTSTPLCATLLGSIDIGTNGALAGWQRLLLEVKGDQVTGIFGGTYGNRSDGTKITGLTAAVGPGGVYVTHRESNTGLVNMRPPTLDAFSLTAPPTLAGDLDGDGDVDLDDYAVFADCLAGPNVTTPPGGCTQAEFDLADLDTDNDVDLGDFAGFQEAFPGT